MDLSRDLATLASDKNPHRRGTRFEGFLADLLRKEGYEVCRNPAAAQPRQTDLIASKDRACFLVEAKWRKAKTDLGQICSARDRLTRVPSDVFACIFSMSGFSEGALDEVRQRRDREIILFDGNEIHALADGRSSFDQLLDFKRRRLRTHAELWFGDRQASDQNRHRLRTSPDVFQVGSTRTEWVRGATDEIEMLFSNEILDCAGAYGTLFSLELHLHIVDLGDLRRALKLLNRELELSGQGSFAIHQRNVGWFGFGFETFVSSVRNQRGRYDELRWESYHHSEELSYVDRLECGGLMCLSSRQSVGEGNYLHSSSVQIFFPGMPIDLTALHHLCAVTGNEEAQLEAVPKNPVETLWFRPGITAEPLWAILSNARADPYTSGIVIGNPFAKSPVPCDEDGSCRDLKRVIRGCELLFCSLKSWHGSKQLMKKYEIRAAQGCWINHYYVMQVMVDWVD